ncbi:cytochrome P450 [Microtetraspora sp. NBRC 16547]|uniref:cytochrome P450 n=1 Tax=Microtetraspora sp. NBRC 16547 TaxID=3030993 RepID=UPI0024A4C23C|nr:cytochrome P450 [Microtetraspora sp. NBRC 16547]GLW97498.1 cytochrome P450 [Microtetraspora sp. NBRC 16547]
MSTGVTEVAREPRTLPFYRSLTRYTRDPIRAFEEAGKEANGELVRLNMGPFKPYLVSHPDHVQHVLRANWSNYVREGMFWDPLKPLIGDGILSDGDTWKESRKILQPLFTAKYVDSLTENMAEILTEQIEETIRPGEPFDLVTAISQIVHPTIVRLFFGDKISREDIAQLVPAYDTAVTAKAIRLVLPFVPGGFPLPGDKAFERSVKTINEVAYARIKEIRNQDNDDRDVVSIVCRARGGELGEIGDKKIRDDVVSMHGASTETSATALTWVWVALDKHPDLAARVYEEIDRVVGGDPISAKHLPELRYLKMFLSELLRLYPAGWLLPRMAVKDDVIGGVTIKAGSTVMVSPYLTHRLPEFWDRPLEFDPERFAPEHEERRNRWAYVPFGGGPHQCLGQHLFMLEALLLVGGILSKYRPVLRSASQVTPRLASSLRPNQNVQMTLVPVERA